MTATRCILDLNDSLQIAMSEMIRHFEGTCDQLGEDGVAESTFFVDEQGVLQELLFKVRSNTFSAYIRFCNTKGWITSVVKYKSLLACFGTCRAASG